MASRETNCSTIWDDENGIVHVVMKKKFVVNEEDAKEHCDACLEFAHNTPKKVLFDISAVSNLTLPGMKQFLDPRLSSLTIALGIIVGLRSPLVSSAMSFFLKLDKEPFPMKIFTNEKEALDWLKNFSEE